VHDQKKRYEDGRQSEYSIQRETPKMLEDNSCVPNKESKHWLHRAKKIKPDCTNQTTKVECAHQRTYDQYSFLDDKIRVHDQKKRYEDGRQSEYSIQRETPKMLEDNSCVPNKESKHWLHRPTVEYPLLIHTN
jgi:hypothetical protein